MTAAPFVATTLPERPYPGLRPFDDKEWMIFFGRERMIDDVIGRLAESRLVLIHGVSGSGKSSLVRAGVLPKLALQYRRHGAPWRTCAMRPSGGPLWNLAAEFAKLEGRESDLEHVSEIAAQFNARSATLASVASSFESLQGKSLCILVDQFEELFRYEKSSRDEVELFIKLIERAATEPEAQTEPEAVDLHVIITMRSEFLGECARFEGFAETINRTQYLVPRVDEQGLMRAVRRPARMYGRPFDEALAERLIASVRGREDELPLLQHGLMLMWDDADRRAEVDERAMLDGRIVEEAGGLAELLSQHADRVMAQAAPNERARRIVEGAFRALIDVNAEGAAIRRPLKFKALCRAAGARPQALRPILDAFRAPGVSFLTPYAPGPIADETIIDISHEALIRCWCKIGDKPNGWLQKEIRAGMRWRTMLFQAEGFARYSANILSDSASRDGEILLFGLNPAWTERYGGGWPKVEAMIRASLEHWKKAAEEREANRRREVENQRLRAEAAEREAREEQLLRDKERLRAEAAERGHDLAQKSELLAKERERTARRITLFVSIAALFGLALAGYALFESRKSLNNETHAIAALSRAAVGEGRALDGVELALAAWPRRAGLLERPMLEDDLRDLSRAFAAHPPILIMHHGGAVSGALFDKDERRILSWSQDNTLRLWDAATGAPIGAAMTHEGPVTGARFDKDERRILSWSRDGTLRLWDAATGAPVGAPMKHDSWVNGALFDKDERRILSWSQDNTLRLWDAATGAPVGAPMKHDGAVNGARFDKDERRILSWSFDNTLRLWDAATGAPIGAAMKHDGAVLGALFDKDERRVLSWSSDKTLRLWDAATGAPIGAPMKHDDWVNGARFDKDERRILSWSFDNTLRLWDAATGAPIGAAMKHDGAVLGALFDKDERRVLSWSQDNTLRLWDAATGAPIGAAMKHDGAVNGARFDKDERRILSWSSDKTLRLWDAATGAPIGAPMKHDDWVEGALFDKDERRILSWSDDNTLRLWNAATGAPVGAAMKHDSWVTGARFDKDERRILSWSSDKTLRLWDAATGAPIGAPMKHDGAVNGARFDKDERRILSWSSDKTLRLWDAATGAPIGAPMKHDDWVEGALFDKDERRILSWSDDKTLRLWNAATGAPVGAPMTHEGPVTGALFDKDGRRILSWSDDKTLRLWDAATGAPIGAPMKHDGAVFGALFDKDERRILSWSSDNTLRFWDASWRGDNLFEIARNYAPTMNSPKEIDRLSDRYGVRIEETICQPGVKIPDPDWSRIERVKAE